MTLIDNSKQKEAIKMIVGLGNPGLEYDNTYHNIGKIALLQIAEAKESNFKKINNMSFRYFIKDDVIFVFSSLYMNESGLSVYEALRYFKIAPQEIIIIQDDSDIEIGKYKITNNQSSGGHNGIKSILKHLDNAPLKRIKIGIRDEDRDDVRRRKASEFVLDVISKKDQATLHEIILNIKESLSLD